MSASVNTSGASASGYEEAAAELRAALTFGIHPSLDGIRALSEALGRPDDAFASIQVTGTNGKTSVVRMTAALLHAHGMGTGAFMSPDLGRYTQRFEFAGEPVSDDHFSRAVAAALEAVEIARSTQGYDQPVTEFELLTAAALWLFRELAVDYVLGPGTLDVEDILLQRAEEQGTHARVVREFGQATPIAEDLTIRYRVLLHSTSPDGHTRVAVRGAHAEYGVLDVAAPAYQAPNVATAVAAAEAALGRALDPALVARALADLEIPGRFEVLAREPWLLVDGAHNPEAAAVLAEAIADAWPDTNCRPTIVLGVLADKDVAGMVAALAPVAGRFACVEPPSPRALTASALARVVQDTTRVSCVIADDLEAFVASERAEGRDVVVTGSLTTVAALREPLLGRRVAVRDDTTIR